MRIAMFHELPKGGGQRAVYEIAKGLRKKGVIVDLYTTEQLDAKAKQSFNRIYHYNFIPKIWQGRNWKRKLYKDTVELLKLYKLHKKIARDINKRDYNIAFINASEFIESPFILRFLKVKSVFYCHDPHDRLVYDPLNSISKNLDILRRTYEKTKRSIRKYLDKQNFLRADVILANSEYTRKMVYKTYGRESIVAYLGVDINLFKPSTKGKLYDVLYIGSTSPLDGFRLFLEVLQDLPKGIRVRSILAEQEWINSSKELLSIYQSSKVVLALGVREPFGLIPLEAMACGIPVVAVDEAGYKESVIDDQTGYLVRRNAHEIALKIKELLTNKNKYKRIEDIARKHAVTNWNWNVSVNRIYNILLKKQK